MADHELQQALAQETELSASLERTARAGLAAGAGATRQMGGLNEAAAMVFVLPLVAYVLKHVGLPWLHEGVRYSELFRQRVHRWIDTQYRAHGFDPDQAEAASESLCQELEQATAGPTRTAWERMLKLVKTSDSEDAGA